MADEVSDQVVYVLPDSAPGTSDTSAAIDVLSQDDARAAFVVARATARAQVKLHWPRAAHRLADVAAAAMSVASGTLDDIDLVDVLTEPQRYGVTVAFADGRWHANVTPQET